jgi:deoxyribose-phosphate aldolase
VIVHRLTTLENRFETDLVTQALDEEGIDYFIKSFQDSAYDGLFVTQKGYALLFVDENQKERARTLVEQVRASVSVGESELEDVDNEDQ